MLRWVSIAPFETPGGASGVLEEREILAGELRGVGRRRCLAARVQRVLPAHRAVDPERGHELLDAPHDEVHQHVLGEAQHVPETGHDHALDPGVVDALLKHVPEVLEHHDRAGARIDELVTQFPHRVQRVRVDDDQPGAQRADQRHGVLQHVRHHQSDAVALAEPGHGQVSREVLRQPIELREGDANPQILERRAVGKAGDRLVDDGGEGRVLVRVDLVRRTLGVAVEPNALRHRSAPLPESLTNSPPRTGIPQSVGGFRSRPPEKRGRGSD